jgi:hypothetical protein
MYTDGQPGLLRSRRGILRLMQYYLGTVPAFLPEDRKVMSSDLMS